MAAGSSPDPTGRAHNAPADPQVRPPDGSHLWHSHPTIRAFGAPLRLWCQNYGHLINDIIQINTSKLAASPSVLLLHVHVMEV